MVIVELTADMRRVVDEQRLGFVATVGPDGWPNVSPKGTTIVFDEHRLMFADVASPTTVANVAGNPRVEINVVDPIVRKGYRFKGHAGVHTVGGTYDRGLQLLQAAGSTLTAERVRSIIVIEVTAAASLISPAYDTGSTEAELAAHWLRRYTSLYNSRFS